MTESNVLELFAYWDDCPNFWQKFIKHCRNNVDFDEDEDEEDVIGYILLRRYGAAFRERGTDSDDLIFPDEQTKFEFILEWS